MAQSDVGTARSVNEDFCGIFEEDGLAIVCDGMGGHNAGAKASRLGVATIRYMYLFLDPTVHYQITKDLVARDLNVASRLIGAIRLANRNIYNQSIREPELRRMGTTVSALAICDGAVIIAHVGDSRIYRFRQDKMELLTEDHTWVNELIQDQEIDREQAKKFDKKNVITRAIGVNGSIKIDLGIEPITHGDLFLICTDGLTKALTDEEIKRIILFNNGNLEHTLRHLIDTANMKDGSDNITVALVSIENIKPGNTVYQPIYLTLKAENKQINRVEDKILKRELYNRMNTEQSQNHLTRVTREKYIRLSGIVASLILVIFLGVFTFSNHHDKQKFGSIAHTQYETPNYFVPKDTMQFPEKVINQFNQNVTDSSLDIENDPLPDSVINNLIRVSIENQGNINPAPKVTNRSLKKNIQNHGVIYLIGLENSNHLDSLSLFIDNKYWGKLIDFCNKGLRLKPGSYSILIQDSTNTNVFQQMKIRLSAGDVKAIELKGR